MFEFWNYVIMRRTANYDLMVKILRFIKKDMEREIPLRVIKNKVIKKFNDVPGKWGITDRIREITVWKKPTKRIDVFVGGFHGFVVVRKSDGKLIYLIGW